MTPEELADRALEGLLHEAPGGVCVPCCMACSYRASVAAAVRQAVLADREAGLAVVEELAESGRHYSDGYAAVRQVVDAIRERPAP